jgi:signal transduction histidine kinase/DNA-binding response OmpR family regulator
LNYDLIFTVYEDPSGLVWAATPMGINKFNPLSSVFKTILENNYLHKNLEGKTIIPIHGSTTENGLETLWLGTDGGLFSYQRGNKIIRKYQHDPLDDNSLSDNFVTTIIEIRSKNETALWVATLNGLNKITPNTGQLERFYVPDTDPTHNMIGSICNDKKGNIWLGTQSSYLYSFNIQTRQFTKHGSYDSQIRRVFIDSSDMFWICTGGNGLFAFDPSTKVEKHYLHNSTNHKSISDNSIRAVSEDGSGNLWLATGGGLNKFNRESETFTCYSEKDGLISNLIRSILMDRKGNLWLGTDKGMSMFDPVSQIFRNFTVRDGLHHNEFWGKPYLSNNNEIFFGGINGMTYFFPDSINKKSRHAPVMLTNFQLFNKNVKPGKNSPLKKEISQTDEIILQHDQSVFSLEFAALEYQHPQKIKYAYKMDNIDPEWVFTDASRRFVTYTQLDPGTYRFHVKATNMDGVWNLRQVSVKISIMPPLWATWWAYSLYGIVFLGLLFAARRYELNRMELKHDLQIKETEANQMQEMDRLKSKFFANISHEFRTPLTLILGPLQKFIENCRSDEDKKQYSLMQRNALRLQKLINQLLDLSRLEAGKLTLAARETDIIQLTRMIAAAFESLAKGRDIELKFETDLDRLAVYIDTDKFEKMISNLLSNAFKFSEDNTEIRIFIHKQETQNGEPGQCIIKIKDQGKGIAAENIGRIFDRFYQVESAADRAYEGNGIGLALTKELVELHHGKITVESEPAKGTVFTIQIPLGKEHLSGIELLDIPAEEIQFENYLPISEIPEEHLTGTDTEDDLPLILVVEDNRDVQSYLTGIMENVYQLIFADNGREGMDQAISNIPDLIVSDVMMPEMDGFTMCRALKNDIRTSHIPIILLTARAGQENKLDGLITGADDYLTKPFDARELQTRIHNLIEQRRILQEKFSSQNPFNPQQIDFSKNDRSFLGQVLETLNKNINNPAFNTTIFAEEIALSRVQLFRKLKSLTGKSVSEFIRHYRLNHAAELLSNNQGNVTEIAYRVGFNHLSHFARYFKDQFGISPSEYSKAHSTGTTDKY